jgi:Prolyl oligopeptidase family
VTLGALEQQDVVSLVNYAIGRRDVDASRIGILGIPMGGATASLAATKDKRIRAVVDDSGFSDAPGVIAASFEHFIHLPAFPFAPITVGIADFRANILQTRPSGDRCERTANKAVAESGYVVAAQNCCDLIANFPFLKSSNSFRRNRNSDWCRFETSSTT